MSFIISLSYFKCLIKRRKIARLIVGDSSVNSDFFSYSEFLGGRPWRRFLLWLNFSRVGDIYAEEWLQCSGKEKDESTTTLWN